MKKIVAGLGFIFTGAIFYVSAFLVGALNVSQTSGWITSLGRFWGTISNYDLMLLIWVGLIIIAIGLVLLLWGAFASEKSSNKN